MFALQANDVLAMRSYAEAKQRYETCKVGRDDGVHYLSRNKDLTIDKVGDEYRCKYRGNACAVYYPDNTVTLSTCGWTTQSTARFIYACTGFRTTSHRGTLYVRLREGYYPIDDLGVNLNDGTPIGPTQQTRRVLDKARAKEIRAPYKPFFTHMLALAKAIDNREGLSDVYKANLPEGALDDTPRTRRELMRGLDLIVDGHEQAQSTLTNWLLYKATEPVSSYAFGRKRHYGTYLPENVHARMTAMVGALIKLKYADAQCWIDEPVPLGDLPKPDLY